MLRSQNTIYPHAVIINDSSSTLFPVPYSNLYPSAPGITRSLVPSCILSSPCLSTSCSFYPRSCSPSSHRFLHHRRYFRSIWSSSRFDVFNRRPSRGGMRDRIHEDLLGHRRLPHRILRLRYRHLHERLRPRRRDDGTKHEKSRR